jgi:hypothetical protein
MATKSASRKAAAKRAVKARKPRAAAKKAGSTAATAEVDARIALVRNNLRDLVEQAASLSGASNEELMSQRIAAQEAKLELLKKQRGES